MKEEKEIFTGYEMIIKVNMPVPINTINTLHCNFMPLTKFKPHLDAT